MNNSEIYESLGLSFVSAEDESLKEEVTFSSSQFSTSAVYTGMQALAKRIQTLFLMEPGTNPSAVTMGIGIRNYLMEFKDNETLTGLNNIALEQIRRFIPSDLVRSVSFMENTSKDGYSSIICVVYINKTQEEFERDYFALEFSSQVSIRSDTISKIYI